MRLIKSLAITVAFAVSTMGTAASAATIHGEFWDSASNITSLAAADAITSAGAADATFASTTIDYPQGSRRAIGGRTVLEDFLGADGASLSGEQTTQVRTSVFRFSGFLDLAAGRQRFDVRAADGFRLTVGGVVISEFDGTRNSMRRNRVRLDAGEGVTAFELLYFENQRRAGIEFKVDNELIVPAAIPLPASLAALLAALGATVLVRRRRTA